MFPSIDTKSAMTVANATMAVFSKMYEGQKPQLLPVLFRDVEAMFGGRYMDFRPVDTPYHDLEHTLQVTWCLVQILAGRWHADAEPRIDGRTYELAVAAALLHDTGYLKTKSDTEGTGAKYTFTHVLRSCAVASSYLPSVGVNLSEIEKVLCAIRCTDSSAVVSRQCFSDPLAGLVGCALATADFLGQMSVPDYLDELVRLYAEFHESDLFAAVPPQQRKFRSAQDLIEKTPHFWRTVVLPRLNGELQGLHRFLSNPYPDGPNPYLEAVEKNIALVSAAAAAHTRQ